MISVVIPVKDGGTDLLRCLEAIRAQRIDEEVEIVVVDSGSTDGSADLAREFGAKVIAIPPGDFRHGSARNLGIQQARGDLLVFTSQDAEAADAHWLSTLATAARSGPTVAGAYGRQLPRHGTRPPEQFFLDFLYGAEGRMQQVELGTEPTFEATLFSNVNSAITRTVLEELPFADDAEMSEDQEWSRRALMVGHTIVYEPAAAVIHSHAYSLRSAFRRFVASGASAPRSYAPDREGRRAVVRAGVRYARAELRWLWATGRRRWIPYAVVYELTKFVGLQIGIRRARKATHAGSASSASSSR